MDPGIIYKGAQAATKPALSILKSGLSLIKNYRTETKLSDLFNHVLSHAEAVKIGNDFYRSFQLTHSEKELIIKLVGALFFCYTNGPEFNYIKIIASTNNIIEPLPLNDYYIQLSCIEGKDIQSRESLINREYSVIQSITGIRNFIPNDYISDALMEDNDRVFIIGNPGAGKSTFAKWFCNRWANNNSETANVFPVYVVLRDLNFDTPDPLTAYISEKYFPLTDVSFLELRKILSLFREQFCLLLDGFDELSNEKQIGLKKNLDTLYENNGKYILLTRPYGLLGTTGWANNLTINIDGFSESNIENYISAVLRIAGKGNQDKRELLKIVSSNKVLADFAHIPLMLSFIVYIYMASEGNGQVLQAIESRYDLQKQVINWMHIYENSKQSMNQNYHSFISTIGEMAYELQINNEFQIKVTYENEKLLKSLSEIGIGNVAKTDAHIAYFNFSSVTFQEYFAAEYLKNDVTKESFLYLCRYKVFWNFAQMLFGAFSSERNETLIEGILNELSKDKKDHQQYIYMLLLAETSRVYVKGRLTEQKLNDLYITYTLGSYNEKYQDILPSAMSAIYRKIDNRQQNVIKKCILRQIEEFGSNVIKESDFIRNLDSSVSVLINYLSLEKDKEFCKELLKKTASLIKDIEQYDPEDADMTISQYIGLLDLFDRKLFSAAEVRTLTYAVFTNRIKNKYWGTHVRLNRGNIDISNELDTFSEFCNIIPTLPAAEAEVTIKNIAARVYNIGTNFALLTRNRQHQFEDLINQHFDEILSLFAKAVSFQEEEESPEMDVDTITGLIVEGLNSTGCAKFFHGITDIIDLAGSFTFAIDIQNNDSFIEYVNNEMIAPLTESFDPLIFSKLQSLVACTSNIKYHFAKIREKLFRIIYNYIISNNEAFTKVSTYSTEDGDRSDEYFEKTAEMDKLLEMTQKNDNLYEFDKKYILDQLILKFTTFREYKYFKENLIPRLLEVDMELYQDSYFEFIASYMNDIALFKFLVAIMRNEKIYHYETNLKFLRKFLEYTLENIENHIDVEPHLNKILEICARTLMLIKKIDKSSFGSLVDIIGNILVRKEMKNLILDKQECLGLNGDSLCAYILQYYFTLNEEYDLKLDYYAMEISLVDKRALLDNILGLFTVQNILNLEDINGIQKVLGPSLMERIRAYMDYDEALQFKFESSRFRSLNMKQ